MGITRQIPPTAGFPFSARGLLPLFRKRGVCGSIEDDFKDYLGLPFAWLTCSGTAAFFLILEALKRLSHKRTVIIPAFVCPLLPLAIHRAGLKVAPCDTNEDNFDFWLPELEQLCQDNRDIAAIVAVHLGGIPLDLDALKSIAARHQLLLIEDCAQSLGAQYKGEKTGACGDFSFFSLARGKGLTIYEGGAIAVRSGEFAAEVDQAIRRLVRRDALMEALRIVELCGYWLFYRPALFWYVWRLPQACWEKLGQPIKAQAENFSINFPLHRVSSFRKAIAHLDFRRLTDENEEQRKKAFFYISGLRQTAGIKIIGEPAGTKAVYPYLTLLFSEEEKKIRAERLLRGLGASRIYAASIPNYPYLEGIVEKRNYPHAKNLARHSLSLSTNTFLTARDMASIVEIIKKVTTS